MHSTSPRMAPFPKSRAARLRERNATFESLLAPVEGDGDATVEMYGFKHLCQRGEQLARAGRCCVTDNGPQAYPITRLPYDRQLGACCWA